MDTVHNSEARAVTEGIDLLPARKSRRAWLFLSPIAAVAVLAAAGAAYAAFTPQPATPLTECERVAQSAPAGAEYLIGCLTPEVDRCRDLQRDGFLVECRLD